MIANLTGAFQISGSITLKPGAILNQAMVAEANAIAQGQLAYYLEEAVFASNVSQLGISTPASTSDWTSFSIVNVSSTLTYVKFEPANQNTFTVIGVSEVVSGMFLVRESFRSSAPGTVSLLTNPALDSVGNVVTFPTDTNGTMIAI